MSDKTHIEWTDATWNPITGCSVVSPGCTNCYAMKLAGTRLQHHTSRAGLTDMSKAGPVWTGEVRFNEHWLDQPRRWKKPRRIFVCAHGDLFHENVPDEWIDKVLAQTLLTPQHVFQVLTKRPERMRDHLLSLSDRDFFKDSPYWPFKNVWFGTSVENQKTADERIPLLLQTPAAVRWISAEPLLGPVDLRTWLDGDDGCECCDDGGEYGTNHCEQAGIPRDHECPKLRSVYETNLGPLDEHGVPEYCLVDKITLDWVVVGGESGNRGRPMHPAWVRSLRDQCQKSHTPFFFKQWGEWAHCPERAHFKDEYRQQWRRVQSGMDETRPALMFKTGKKTSGRLLDGQEYNEEPKL